VATRIADRCQLWKKLHLRLCWKFKTVWVWNHYASDRYAFLCYLSRVGEEVKESVETFTKQQGWGNRYKSRLGGVSYGV